MNTTVEIPCCQEGWDVKLGLSFQAVKFPLQLTGFGAGHCSHRHHHLDESDVHAGEAIACKLEIRGSS